MDPITVLVFNQIVLDKARMKFICRKKMHICIAKIYVNTKYCK